MRPASDGLWAITSYFNPMGYRRRLENYQVFRRHLSVPLVTVELSFDGHFELSGADADIVVQLQGGDVMWQKERLLNVALGHVPFTCQRLAWIDCDVIFASDDWPARAVRALDNCAFVHLFHERYDLPPSVSGREPRLPVSGTPFLSSVYKILTGEATTEDLARRSILLTHGSSPGLGWAARREVLESHGFYDVCIAGGGDRPFICAALGAFDAGARSQQMNDRRAAHFLRWARPFFDTVQGRVGYIAGQIFHLWHGSLEDRRYDDRLSALADFDPCSDIALEACGSWRWNSDKSELHASLARYFAGRNEDGSGRR